MFLKLGDVYLIHLLNGWRNIFVLKKHIGLEEVLEDVSCRLVMNVNNNMKAGKMAPSVAFSLLVIIDRYR